ncbi:hypothetical protein Q9R46_13850 [Paenibacillus sp. RRE4]|uniref:hypothetical protein n=1 Tax=Paenibacillus sp. RRE4 TaxID=2962587 RepID=UPI00288138D1|nr:hypothetical protein [Paenibacillus sp. RRE4]MDT0123738.1 hypothetical protein [Paenibacillus sp. RRE4]
MRKGLIIGALIVIAIIVFFIFNKDSVPTESTRYIISVDHEGDSCKVTVDSPPKSKKSTQTERFESPSCNKLKEGNVITYRYLNEGKYLYIVSINKELTKDPLAGVVTKKNENDGKYYITVSSTSFGEEKFPVDKKDWARVNIRSNLAFYLDDWGTPINITKIQ